MLDKEQERAVVLEKVMRSKQMKGGKGVSAPIFDAAANDE